MRKFKVILFYLSSLVLVAELHAQDSIKDSIRSPQGITIGYGIGNYAMVDEYISQEKYTGSMPYFCIGWTNQHRKYVYQLGLAYQYSSGIKNHTVSAEIYQFSLRQGFLYRITDFILFGKNSRLYLGPSTDLCFYYNDQTIAISGFDYSNSFAALLSLGLHSKLIYSISANFSLEAAANFNALSLGIRMVDSEESNESPVKPLTLINGLDATCNVGGRYYFLEKLSLGVKYLFNTTRISAWDPLRTASDNMVVDLTLTF